MPDEFPCDVFLSHSAKDKAVVRPLAERLRADGVKVWFDEWVLKPGDSIEKNQSKTAKIKEGQLRRGAALHPPPRTARHGRLRPRQAATKRALVGFYAHSDRVCFA